MSVSLDIAIFVGTWLTVGAACWLVFGLLDFRFVVPDEETARVDLLSRP